MVLFLGCVVADPEVEEVEVVLGIEASNGIGISRSVRDLGRGAREDGRNRAVPPSGRPSGPCAARRRGSTGSDGWHTSR